MLCANENRAVNMYLSRHGKTPISVVTAVDVYLRMRHEGQVYHSRWYTHVTARNCFTVSFKNECRNWEEESGQVELYVALGPHKVAILRPLTPVSTSILQASSGDNDDPFSVALGRHFEEQGILNGQLSMAKQVTPSSQLVAVDADSVTRKQVFVHVGSKSFVSKIPNFFECD